MKIFTDTKSSKNPFDKYLGKDIWVKCQINDKNHYGDIAYIRFYSVDEDGLYTCTWLTEDMIKQFSSSHGWFCIKQMSEIDYFYSSELKIVKPVTTLTSPEICPEYSSDVEELLEYVGADIWVKVECAETYFYDPIYIKILSVDGIMLTYRFVDANILEDEWVERHMYDNFLEDFDSDATETTSAYMFKICRPISVLTDEDVTETLEHIEVWDDSDAW